jgi:capsule polysaccharide export protein KpsE/RkpR
VLDKGLVIAGDIKVSLAEVELLTIRIRLIVCSIDKAQSIGLDWWKYDHHLAPHANELAAENEALKKQIAQLERRVRASENGRVARTIGAPKLGVPKPVTPARPHAKKK